MLDALWARLGIPETMTALLGRTRRDAVTERVLFALVADRALAPSSKLAASGWVSHDVHIGALPETTDDACYRLPHAFPQATAPFRVTRQPISCGT